MVKYLTVLRRRYELGVNFFGFSIFRLGAVHVKSFGAEPMSIGLKSYKSLAKQAWGERFRDFPAINSYSCFFFKKGHVGKKIVVTVFISTTSGEGLAFRFAIPNSRSRTTAEARARAHVALQQPVNPGVPTLNSSMQSSNPSVSQLIPHSKMSSFVPAASAFTLTLTRPDYFMLQYVHWKVGAQAEGSVFNPSDMNNTATTRLFDDGFMDPFVTAALWTKSKIPTLRHKPVSVSGYGEVTEFKEDDVVMMSVANYFGKVSRP